MRIRTIKPQFWTHELLAGLKPEACLLAIGLLNYADDEGYFNANPKLIASALFPLRELKGTVAEMLTDLEAINWIKITTAPDGRTYGRITTFLDHQKINRPTPSKIAKLCLFNESSLNKHGRVNAFSPPEKEKEKEEGEGKEIYNAGGREGVVSGNGLQLLETDPNALAAKNLAAFFATTWEAVRGRPMPEGHQAAAYRLCKLAIEYGQDPADMEDALAWLSNNHGQPGVPTLKPPAKLAPDWFDAIADAIAREQSKHEKKIAYI